MKHMIWALIWWSVTFQHPFVVERFATKKACEAAAKVIVKDYVEPTDVIVFCGTKAGK